MSCMDPDHPMLTPTAVGPVSGPEDRGLLTTALGCLEITKEGREEAG